MSVLTDAVGLCKAARRLGVDTITISVDTLEAIAGVRNTSAHAEIVSDLMKIRFGVDATDAKHVSDEYGTVYPRSILRWCLILLGHNKAEVARTVGVSPQSVYESICTVESNAESLTMAGKVLRGIQ